MSGVLAPQWLLQALTDAGAVASGARLFSYVAGGGNVPTPVYADKALTTPLSNPYQFNSAGRGEFWLDPSIVYRLRLETATGTLLAERDGVEGALNSRFVLVADLADDTDAAKGADLVGYKGRTVRDRLAEPGVSVMDHGAVADYVKPTIAAPNPPLNTNNQAAFQAAADEAASLGVPLIVPPGSYYLGSKFTCSTDIIIDGEICIDHRTALYNPGHGGSIASLPIAVVWSGSGRVISGSGGFWCPGRHRYDPALTGAVNGGMYCFILMEGTVGTPSVGNLVSGITLENGHFASVMIGSYCSYPWINNCRFLGNGYCILYDDQNSGFKSRGSFGMRATANTFRGEDWTSTATTWATTNSAWGGDPIEFNAPIEGTSDCVADGNDIREIYSASVVGGIGIGMAKVTGFSIRENYVRRTHHDGIHVEDFSSGGIVQGNHVALANRGAGSAAISCEISEDCVFADNTVFGSIAVNGWLNFGPNKLPTTSKMVTLEENRTTGPVFIINQSNVRILRNEVIRTVGTAPAPGLDGIQITVGAGTADAEMQNIYAEGNYVSGFYREIAVTGSALSEIQDVRIARNFTPPYALSAAPANEKSIWANAFVANVRLDDNDYEIGIKPKNLLIPTGDPVPEGDLIGDKGDIAHYRDGGYGSLLWAKLSGDGTNSGWIPMGHLGVFLLDRTDGTAITAWARWIRYRGTGGHNFAIAAATETGRLLTFANNGSGTITVTPASGTINVYASVSIPVGFALTIADTNNGTWRIVSMHGISTGWTADTGTAKKTANATYTVGSALTVGAVYSQAEVTAIITRLGLVEAALRDATQTIKAMKDASIAKLDYA